jgi:putative transposase
MSDKYKIQENGLHFVTLTVVGWIDIFTRSAYSDEIIKNLNHCIKEKGLRISAFCIMSSHIHMIVYTEGEPLGKILRDFKSFTAKRLIKMITENIEESRKEWLLYMFRFYAKRNAHNSEYQFWQQNNHAFYLYSNKLIEQKTNYIHENPVNARIVERPHHYIYSSANKFTELKLSEI